MRRCFIYLILIFSLDISPSFSPLQLLLPLLLRQVQHVRELPVVAFALLVDEPEEDGGFERVDILA